MLNHAWTGISNSKYVHFKRDIIYSLHNNIWITGFVKQFQVINLIYSNHVGIGEKVFTIFPNFIPYYGYYPV